MNAKDEGTGKFEKITITNDKDRPTEEDIEKMIKDAATYADENKKAKARVHAENAFASYLHSMKSITEGSGSSSASRKVTR